MRMSDVADQEQIFRIIQSVSSPKAEPFKQWMAMVASQRTLFLCDSVCIYYVIFCVFVDFYLHILDFFRTFALEMYHPNGRFFDTYIWVILGGALWGSFCRWFCPLA